MAPSLRQCIPLVAYMSFGQRATQPYRQLGALDDLRRGSPIVSVRSTHVGPPPTAVFPCVPRLGLEVRVDGVFDHFGRLRQYRRIRLTSARPPRITHIRFKLSRRVEIRYTYIATIVSPGLVISR